MNSDLTKVYEYRINSGVLLLLNCPKFMEFGIDYSAWTIGEKFMGIKLIPDGPHFIYYSTHDENYSFKQGFFIHVNNTTKIHIRKWCVDVGDFVNLKEEDEKNFSIGVQNLDFDPYLGNYPLHDLNNWIDLTKFIDETLRQKLEPVSRKYITSSKEYDTEDLNFKGNIFFTNIPNKKFNLGHNTKLKSPEEITKVNMDKSSILEDLLVKEYNLDTNKLLGEFQYSFVTFFLCEVYESFEQWKKLFILFCSCQDSLTKREKFFCDFIEVIYHMFRQFPKDFFLNEITSDNFFNKILRDFMENCETALPYNSPVSKRIKLLKRFLKEYFDFTIKEEEERIIEKYLKKENYCNPDEDDELPAIVEIEEIESLMNNQIDDNIIMNNN